MSTVTVAELFKHLLKNSKAHQDKYLSDLENNYLPATVANRIILAKNKDELFSDNPDLELEHIDRTYDRPLDDVSGMSDEDYLRYQQDYAKGAAEAQIVDPNLAKQVTKNIDKRLGYYNNVDELKKYNTNIDDAWANLRNFNLDRMLANLYKRDMSDEEKLEVALRLIYNNATRQFNRSPADMKLDQDDLYASLPLDTVDALQAKEPGFLERQRVLSDTIPLAYTSDKWFDEDRQEHSIFTPTDETNAVYGMFAEKFLKDLQDGNAPDIDDLTQYITKLYSDRLRTMPYDEWQKLMDKEAEEINRRKSEELGRPLSESEKVELDVPDEALTPEDWAGNMKPEQYKVGKTAAEKAENKLNRWHKDNKEEYKEYLEDMAATRDPDDYRAVIDSAELDTAMQAIVAYIQKKLPILCQNFETANNLDDTAKARKLSNKIAYYYDILKGTESGVTELNNWARRYVSNTHRKAHDLEDHRLSDAEKQKRREVWEEMASYMNDPNTPSWAREAYNHVAKKMQLAKKQAAEQDEILEKEYKGMSGSDLKNAVSIQDYFDKPEGMEE